MNDFLSLESEVKLKKLIVIKIINQIRVICCYVWSKMTTNQGEVYEYYHSAYDTFRGDKLYLGTKDVYYMGKTKSSEKVRGIVMIGFIITGHGAYAPGIHGTMEMITGKQEKVKVIPFLPEMTLEVFKMKLLQVLILLKRSIRNNYFSDLLGGTPFKIAAEKL